MTRRWLGGVCLLAGACALGLYLTFSSPGNAQAPSPIVTVPGSTISLPAINVTNYGAVADAQVATVNCSLVTTALTCGLLVSGNGIFSLSDLGKSIEIPTAAGGGISPAPPLTLLTTIISVNTPESGNTFKNAVISGSGTATNVIITWGTDNSTPFTNAANACPSPSNGTGNLGTGFTSKGCVIYVPNPGGSGTGDYMFGSSVSSVAVALPTQTSFQIIGMGNSGKAESSAQAGVRLITAMPITIFSIGQVYGGGSTPIGSNLGGFHLENITFRDTSSNGSAIGGLLMNGVSEALIAYCSFENFNGQQADVNSNAISLSYGMKATTYGGGAALFNNNIILLQDKGKNNSIWYDGSQGAQDGPIFLGGDVFPTNNLSGAPSKGPWTGTCIGIVSSGAIRVYGTHFDVGQDNSSPTPKDCVGVLGLTAGVVSAKFESSALTSGTPAGTGVQVGVAGMTSSGGNFTFLSSDVTKSGGVVTIGKQTSPATVAGQIITVKSSMSQIQIDGTFLVTSVTGSSITYDDPGTGGVTLGGTLTAKVPFSLNVQGIFNNLTTDVSVNGGAKNNNIVDYSSNNGTTTVSDGGTNDIVQVLGASGGTTNTSTFTGTLVVPVAPNATPTSNGAIAYDSTANAPVVGETLGGSSSSATATMVRGVSIQGPSGSPIDAGTVGTTETPFATTYVFPAGYWTARKAVRVSAVVQEVTPGTAVSFLFKLAFLKTGPVEVPLYASIANKPPISTTQSSGSSFILRCVSTGGTGTMDTANLPGLAVVGPANTVTQPVTFDTTVAQTLEVTVTFGAMTAGNTALLRLLTVEELN
ncbi:MAG TPA: hypothetical protein VGW33_05540 [Terriglobia bacterium]|nr:hypothetical protein [Terriglobia bacterium]